jgi:hypothetical protein
MRRATCSFPTCHHYCNNTIQGEQHVASSLVIIVFVVFDNVFVVFDIDSRRRKKEWWLPKENVGGFPYVTLDSIVQASKTWLNYMEVFGFCELWTFARGRSKVIPFPMQNSPCFNFHLLPSNLISRVLPCGKKYIILFLFEGRNWFQYNHVINCWLLKKSFLMWNVMNNFICNQIKVCYVFFIFIMCISLE